MIVGSLISGGEASLEEKYRSKIHQIINKQTNSMSRTLAWRCGADWISHELGSAGDNLAM